MKKSENKGMYIKGQTAGYPHHNAEGKIQDISTGLFTAVRNRTMETAPQQTEGDNHIGSDHHHGAGHNYSYIDYGSHHPGTVLIFTVKDLVNNSQKQTE